MPTGDWCSAKTARTSSPAAWAGLGLKVARWLADRGARHLVLVGRSGASAEGRRQVDELEKAGVEVAVRRVNMGDRAGSRRSARRKSA